MASDTPTGDSFMASPDAKTYADSTTASSEMDYKKLRKSSSSYPTPTSRLTSAIKEPKETTEIAWFKRRTVWRPLLHLELFGVFVLFMTILGFTIDIHLKTGENWKMLPTPNHADFDEYSITSSSETCNEMARELAMNDVGAPALALYLTVCLHIAEPQSSGLGGVSSMVYGNAITGDCYQGTGHAVFGRSILKLHDMLRTEQSAEHIGQASSVLPMELRTLSGLVQLMFLGMNKSETEAEANLSQIVMKRLSYEINFERLQFPVSHALGDALEIGKLELAIALGDKFEALTLTTQETNVLEEGELFKSSQLVLFIIYLTECLGEIGCYQELLKAKYPQIFDELFRMPYLNGEDDFEDFYEKTSELQELLNRPDVLQNISHISRIPKSASLQKAGLTFCSPIGNTSTGYSAVGDALTSFDTKESMTDPTTDIRMYELILKGLMHIYNTASTKDSMARSDSKQPRENELYLKKLQGLMRSDPMVSFSSNQVVVVDHKRQTAIAVTATIGSKFGSQDIAAGGSMIMNNLMSLTGKYFDEIRDHDNDMEPMIVFKDKKIHLAYAGSGGFLTRSLSVARQLSSLIMSLLWATPLERALTAPLYVRMPGGQRFVSEGMPWNIANKLSKIYKGTPVGPDQTDRAAAVHGRRAMYFDGTGHVKIMPNGY